MEGNEDEIEYFGFLPVSFTAELQEGLEDALKEVMQRNGPVPGKIQAQILDVLKRNIFIFNNFVLRNILKFPNGFRFERKVSDKVICEDVSQLTGLLADAQRQVVALKEEKAVIMAGIRIEENRAAGYAALLKGKERYHQMAEAAMEIKKFMRETRDIYDTLKITACTRDNEFENLLEYKNIKNIYYKEEKMRLFDIASLETLSLLTEKMHLQGVASEWRSCEK